MRTYSSEQKQRIERVGDVGYIWWDEVVLTDYEDTQYSYYMVKFKKNCTRAELIQAVVRLRYPDYDAEIAALANGDPEHQQWRQLAKELADEVLA